MTARATFTKAILKRAIEAAWKAKIRTANAAEQLDINLAREDGMRHRWEAK